MLNQYAKRKDSNHAEIAEAFEQAGAFVFDASGMGRGLPDLIVCVDGLVHLVEVKDIKGKATDAQIDLAVRLASAGVTVHTVRTPDIARELVESGFGRLIGGEGCNAPVSGGIPSAQVAGLDWLRYLSETGHGSQYDTHCQCSFCESVRREYPRWLSEHPNTPGQRSAAQGEDHAKS